MNNEHGHYNGELNLKPFGESGEAAVNLSCCDSGNRRISMKNFHNCATHRFRTHAY